MTLLKKKILISNDCKTKYVQSESVNHFSVSLPDKMFHLRNWQRLLRHRATWLWNAHITGAQLSQLPVSTSTVSRALACVYLRQRRKRFDPNETKPAAASHWSELLASKNLGIPASLRAPQLDGLLYMQSFCSVHILRPTKANIYI